MDLSSEQVRDTIFPAKAPAFLSPSKQEVNITTTEEEKTITHSPQFFHDISTLWQYAVIHFFIILPPMSFPAARFIK